MLQEIPIPLEDCPFRAFRDRDEIRIEPVPLPEGLKRLGLGIILMVAVLPLAGYLAAAVAILWNGANLHWLAHVVGIVFGVLFLVVVGWQAIDAYRLIGSTLSRHDGISLRLVHQRPSGRQRVYILKEPATLIMVLDHEPGGTVGWRRIRDTRGIARREWTRDTIDVGICLKEASVSPRMPLQAKGWVQVYPRNARINFTADDPEGNLAAALQALRPLAEAFDAGLGLPVEFHQAGGGRLDTSSRVHPELNSRGTSATRHL